jgi:UDP-GlcNAc:undecaprenyl-phosphate GlcNAc-1-phosphate transferase
MDHPEERKVHERPIPTAGGITVAFSFYSTLWLAFFFYKESFAMTSSAVMGLTLAGGIILCLGLYDDLKGCAPATKIAFQVVAGSILCAYGFGVERITNPFGGALSLGLLNVPATILWIVLIVNAINVIDGLDGLAGGIIFISSCTLFVIAASFSETAMAVPCLVLAGAALGFLRYNFPPARVFLGDTGSMFLGLIIASVSLLANRKGTVTVTLLLPIVLMGVPLIDTVLAFLRRSVDMQSPFRNDARHLHHRLLYLGLSQRQVVMFIYLICIYLSLTAVILSIMPTKYAFLVLLILAVGISIGVQALRFVEDRLEAQDHEKSQAANVRWISKQTLKERGRFPKS